MNEFNVRDFGLNKCGALYPFFHSRLRSRKAHSTHFTSPPTPRAPTSPVCIYNSMGPRRRRGRVRMYVRPPSLGTAVTVLTPPATASHSQASALTGPVTVFRWRRLLLTNVKVDRPLVARCTTAWGVRYASSLSFLPSFLLSFLTALAS